MPSPPSPNPGTESNPILLVEEYDALASAILAALHKFVPQHRATRVRSLAAARKALRAGVPELIILDFDPPLSGIVDFLSGLRTAAPAARLLVLAAGLPPEVRQPHARAVHFVEKPFELAALGLALQGLLTGTGPGAADDDAPITAARDLMLFDLLPLVCLSGETGVVKITDLDGDRAGEIHFRRGQIRHALAGDLSGIHALRGMMGWELANFAFDEAPLVFEKSIDGPWAKVLKKALVSAEPPKRARRKSLPTRRSPAAKKANGQPLNKKVLVIDDTEMLRIFVEEVLSELPVEIVLAADATEGVRLSASWLPDLILLDYSLPDFNGDEVCRRLLAEETTRQIPIIMMSGHVAEMATTALEYGNVVRTLPKPFVSAALVAVVTEVLDRPHQSPPSLAPSSPPPEKNGKTSSARNGDALRETSPPPVEPAAAPVAEMTKPEPEPELAASPLLPAHIPIATRDSVVLSFSLEVLSIRFSAALKIAALRAKLASDTVLAYVDTRALPANGLRTASFTLGAVSLDSEGRLLSARVIPGPSAPPLAALQAVMGVDDIDLQTEAHHGSFELASSGHSSLQLRLLIAFDLAGVELTPTFEIAYVALHARLPRVRVVLPGPGGKEGLIFEEFLVTLAPDGRIAEIRLDSVVP